SRRTRRLVSRLTQVIPVVRPVVGTRSPVVGTTLPASESILETLTPIRPQRPRLAKWRALERPRAISHVDSRRMGAGHHDVRVVYVRLHQSEERGGICRM